MNVARRSSTGSRLATTALASNRPAFTPVEVKELRVRAGGQTNRNVVMEIAGLAEEIDVLPPEDDAQLLGAFTEQLTAEQLAALPDDPDELAQVLQQLVGENADIRVNGFAGGRLPAGHADSGSPHPLRRCLGQAAMAVRASRCARVPEAAAGGTRST